MLRLDMLSPWLIVELFCDRFTFAIAAYFRKCWSGIDLVWWELSPLSTNSELPYLAGSVKLPEFKCSFDINLLVEACD